MAFVFISSALGLEVSISGAVEHEYVNNYKKIPESILYVDMEKVFDSHLKTQGHKKEIQDFAKTRKTIIEEIEEMVKEFNSFFKDKTRNINLRISDGPRPQKIIILLSAS